MQARWSRNGKEIYYGSDKHILVVPMDASGAEPAFGKPTALFGDEYDFGQGLSIANYEVTMDGHFIMLRRGANPRTVSRRRLGHQLQANRELV